MKFGIFDDWDDDFDESIDYGSAKVVSTAVASNVQLPGAYSSAGSPSSRPIPAPRRPSVKLVSPLSYLKPSRKAPPPRGTFRCPSPDSDTASSEHSDNEGDDAPEEIISGSLHSDDRSDVTEALVHATQRISIASNRTPIKSPRAGDRWLQSTPNTAGSTTSWRSIHSSPGTARSPSGSSTTRCDSAHDAKIVLQEYLNYAEAQDVLQHDAKSAGQSAVARKAAEVKQQRARIREDALRSQDTQLAEVLRTAEHANQTLSQLLRHSDQQESELSASLARRKDEAFLQLDAMLVAVAKEREEEQKRREAEEARLKKLKEEQEAREAEARRIEEARILREAQEEAEREEAERKQLVRANQGQIDAEARMAKITEINQFIVPQVANNPGLKKFCFDAKMKIRAKIGQLTNSREHIRKIRTELDQLFNQAKEASPVAHAWILNFFAKAVVKQAETEVRVKHSSAFPLARLCVSLFLRHTQLVALLIGRMDKNCPYIAPRYINKKPEQSVEEYRRALGYNRAEESEEQYNERMCGIIALFSAIVQTTPASSTATNPFGMDQGWAWIARILNRFPRRITPMLLNTFLEIAGPAFIEKYQHQAHKLIRFLIQDFIPRLPAESLAANTRLRTFLERYIQQRGRIEVMQGRELAP